jgi:N-acetylmuramoyl-L-alanine amidase
MPLAGHVIVIDPGHATKNEAGFIINPGARAKRGVYERDANLSVADKLRNLLEAQGAKVYMTRTITNPWRYGAQRTWDNRSRAIFANSLGAEAYVRIHCDWNRDRHYKGFTTYYFRWGSRPLARRIHRSMIAAIGQEHRDNGVHRRSFVSVTSQMPTVLLELGLLSNKQEGKDLGLDAFQSRVSQAISAGIVDYFQKLDRDNQKIYRNHERLRQLSQ